jgi:hypothetical protein
MWQAGPACAGPEHVLKGCPMLLCRLVVAVGLAICLCMALGRDAQALKENNKQHNTTGTQYTTAAKSKLAEELCECAVAAKVVGILAIPLGDVGTQKLSQARAQEFLAAAKQFMSPQFVDAKYKAMLIQFVTPEKLNDDYANKFILEHAHMCSYVLQHRYERLQYWNDLVTGK